MKLHLLSKTVKTKKRRLGQGHGSGRVKTSGRGTKGQNARSNRSLSFEGGALPLMKRLPFMRGKGRNKGSRKHVVIVSVGDLNNLPKQTMVTRETLIKHNMLSKKEKDARIKILGDGTLSIALTVQLPVSKKAMEKIEKAGGTTLQTGV